MFLVVLSTQQYSTWFSELMTDKWLLSLSVWKAGFSASICGCSSFQLETTGSKESDNSVLKWDVPALGPAADLSWTSGKWWSGFCNAGFDLAAIKAYQDLIVFWSRRATWEKALGMPLPAGWTLQAQFAWESVILVLQDWALVHWMWYPLGDNLQLHSTFIFLT